MNDDFFQKGQSAVLQDGIKTEAARKEYSRYVGTECTILSDLGFVFCKNLQGESVIRFGYKVLAFDGRKFRVHPRDLKKPDSVH